MREDTRRLARRAVIPLAVVALAGLSASCGDQTQSADRGEKPAHKAESTQAPAPAAAKPAGKEKTAETTEAKKPEKPRPEEAPAEQRTTERTAERAAQDQYAAKQYAADPNASAGQQYAARQAARERGTDPASPSAPATAAPSSTALSLTVPKLGLYGVPVVDDVSEAGLSQGVGHLPGTGFPWQGAGSNTYIAGHRLGYPGTPSDHVFYGLPNLAVGDPVSLTDANGTTYDYAVSEIHEVSPSDLWVSSPVAGRDMVTLQTCIENFGDEWTPGPDWLARYIVRADRV